MRGLFFRKSNEKYMFFQHRYVLNRTTIPINARLGQSLMYVFRHWLKQGC